MWSFAIDAAKWVWAERAFLGPIFSKYRSLPGGDIKFDGPKVKALIEKYEPSVFSVVSGGSSITAAVLSLVISNLAPHKMTPEEEKVWFDRATQAGG